ncbi:hypothetical protein RhiirA5_429893 [Rhizophagus irregularis]|uniref:Uncharacterized protein n=1 Tax=Rhizophagus irregularis TaxID=588596 RepID=A0A2N0NXN4_9GLOM|nr:hypothetical protein RhiirA5_429893 [Rhizophagus irregularis]
MEIDYGKQVFDNYFSQVVTILTIFLVSGKGQFYEFFDDTFIFLSILLPTILRFFLTDHRYWVEVYDDPSKKIVSPFESPKYINSFCLTKSDNLGLVYTFLNTKYVKFPLRCLSYLRFIWFVVLSLTPGVVFGILLSEENHYLYKISTSLPISACVSIVRHYVGKDVHTFFSHFINHHRMFKKSIENLDRAEDIISKLDPEAVKMSNDLKKGTRAWVRKNINNTSTCILQITEKLKEKIILDHKIDVNLNEIEQSLDPNQQKEVLLNFKDVSLRFTKEIKEKLEKNIGSDLKDEIDSNLTQIIDSKFGKINSNDEKGAGSIEQKIGSKLSEIKDKVTKLFTKFEDDMEGCGLYQILTEEDKADIERNSGNINNIKIYLENHEGLIKRSIDSNNSDREPNKEELSDIKCDC